MRNPPFSGLEQIKYFKQIKMPEIAIIYMGYYSEEKILWIVMKSCVHCWILTTNKLLIIKNVHNFLKQNCHKKCLHACDFFHAFLKQRSEERQHRDHFKKN